MDGLITIAINRSHGKFRLSDKCMNKYIKLGGTRSYFCNCLKERSESLLLESIKWCSNNDYEYNSSSSDIRLINIPSHLFNAKYIHISDNNGLEWPFLNFQAYKLDEIKKVIEERSDSEIDNNIKAKIQKILDLQAPVLETYYP